MKDSLPGLANAYFNYLAKRFPVMCASDEFHFLPRVQAASKHYDLVDSIDPDVIGECVSTLKDLQERLAGLAINEHDLEALTDLALLKANMAGVLIEMETKRSWRFNPLFYLKVAFIGLDHALTKPASEPRERTARVLARLHSIPRLLQQATDNMGRVAKTYHQAALAMLDDCKRYLHEIGKRLAKTNARHMTEGLEKTRTSLHAFGKFLCALSPAPDQQVVTRVFEATLKDHFLCTRSPTDIFQLASEEWHQNLEQLKNLQKNIDPGKSWRELYHAYCPPNAKNRDTISLYADEIDRLRRFFRQHGFTSVALSSPLVLCTTPTYLRSVRGSASFSAAFSDDTREKDICYVTTHQADKMRTQTTDLLEERLHREHRFLAAHETVPGHHLLDSVRRGLENPVRRQIESPLFYEGWACYAETLLAEYGYVDNPLDRLVDYKRRLWRAARCQIDVGLNNGIISEENAIDLLTAAGFAREEAHGQIDRFRLNPGYQLCYTLGHYEIMKLRETYGIRMGRDQFHRQLLEAGELPFHLSEKRFEMGERS